jgi:transcriptional regulator with XRE-family HTH domain
MTIGDNIKAIREQLGISQRELGRRVGISSATMHQIESGHIKSPSVDTALRIPRVLGVSVELLMSEVLPVVPVRKKHVFMLTDAEAENIKHHLAFGQNVMDTMRELETVHAMRKERERRDIDK